MMMNRHSWVNMTVPNSWAHPFVFQARDGRSWEKMLIGLPDGVSLDGRDMGGWAFSVFSTRLSKQDKLDGEPVRIGLPADRPVTLFRGRGAEREQYRVKNPRLLAEAIGNRTTTNHEPHVAEPVATDTPACALPQIVRGEIADAAPPASEAASAKAVHLMGRLALDDGFTSLMDELVHQAAEAFARDDYDPHAVLQTVADWTGKLADACTEAYGETYTHADILQAAGMALSAITETINEQIGKLTEAGLALPHIAEANRRQRRERIDTYFEERAMLDPETLLRTTYSLNAPTTAEALWAMGRVYGSQPRTQLIDGDVKTQNEVESTVPMTTTDSHSLDITGIAGTLYISGIESANDSFGARR